MRAIGVATAPLILLLAAWQQDAGGRPYRASGFVALAIASAVIAILVVAPRVRWLVPAVAPLLIASALGIFLGPRAAVLPAIFGVVFAILLAAGVDVATPIEAATARFGTGLTAFVGWLAFLILVLPAWLWTRLRRRDALRPSAPDRSPHWTVTEAWDSTPRSLGQGARPSAGGGRSAFGRLTWGVGCVALLLLANFGAGWSWDQAFPTDPPSSSTADAPRTEGPVSRDPRNDVPAMAAYPWREQYFEDIQRTTGGYWPFTEYRPNDFSSRYVNQEGWRRRTYRPAGDTAAMPTVWMFGGSTTWGEGQRDEYTIASWIARLAEEDGLPVRVANYGHRGWTHFQEMILYEQELARLARADRPDFSIFYDGANEITTQSLLTEAVPSHTLVYGYAKQLAGSTVATEFVQTGDDGPGFDAAWVAYREHSALHKLVGYFRASPAAATPAQDDLEGIEDEQDANESGSVSDYQMTEQDGIDAGRVYERGKQFTLMLSQRYEVTPFLFWQPVGYLGPPHQRAVEQLTEPTIDISDILADHDDVFIDGGHTNEEGARLVAVEIWRQMEPAIRAWYQRGG